MKKLFLMSLVLVSGCASNQKFDCPYNEGVCCLSVSEVDRQVSAGKIGSQEKTPKKERIGFFQKSKKTIEPPTNVSTVRFDEELPLRTQEEVLHLWIAAYESEDGIYHQPTKVTTVLKPAGWLGSVSEVKGN